MAVFEKRSLLHTVLLTACTFGLYLIYWAVVTKRELNKAGGHVPNAFLVIIPLANLYFWYRYAQSYATIVKRNNHRSEVLAYFFVALMPLLPSFTGLTRIVGGALIYMVGSVVHHIVPNTIILINPNSYIQVFVFLLSLALIAAKITVFQDGYNEYQN